MSFRFDVTFSEDPRKLSAALGRRLKNVQTVIGRTLAERTSEAVKSKIPTGSNWLTIYKNSITYRESEDGDSWAVAGLATFDITTVPAKTTLIGFQGSDEYGSILKPYNPWPIDAVPAIAGGYKDTVVARQVSEQAVTAARSRIDNLISVIKAALVDRGAQILDGQPAVIAGKTYADLAYLAERLELGLDGAVKKPHWGPAAAKLTASAEAWIKDKQALDLIGLALSGGQLPSALTMSAAEAEQLAKIREATWP